MRWLLVAIGIFGLSGCQRGFDIEVAGNIDRPTFTLTKAALSKGVCFTAVNIVQPSSGRLTYFWGIFAKSKCVEVKELVYGTVPIGLVEGRPLVPLREGDIYKINASGNGWTGSLSFTCDAEHCRATNK